MALIPRSPRVWHGCQREYEAAPGATREQRLHRISLGRRLDAAKAIAAKIQQGPEAPRATMPMPTADPKRVQALREEIRMKLNH